MERGHASSAIEWPSRRAWYDFEAVFTCPAGAPPGLDSSPPDCLLGVLSSRCLLASWTGSCSMIVDVLVGGQRGEGDTGGGARGLTLFGRRGGFTQGEGSFVTWMGSARGDIAMLSIDVAGSVSCCAVSCRCSSVSST